MNGSPPGHRERERSRSLSRRRSFSRSRSRSRSRKNYRRGYRSRSRSRGGRSHSRSPMSSRRRHTTNRDNPGPNKCLGVFGLSLRTTERDLREVFTRYGPIEECTVVIDAQTGRSRGFAFIYYESMEDAKAAKDSCNGIEIDNRRIRVDFSITQRAHTPTPGIYMGKPTMDGKPRRRRDDYRGYRRSPSPYYRRRRHSRSRSYSPRRY
jgi:transformer-2 protein